MNVENEHDRAGRLGALRERMAQRGWRDGANPVLPEPERVRHARWLPAPIVR